MIPDWKRADLAALGIVVEDEPTTPEPKKERATRKPTTEKAVKE